MVSNVYKTFWNPKHAFEEVFNELKKAKNSIYIETFMFESDSVGKKLVDILIEKSKTINVVLVVDGYGLQKISSKYQNLILESKINYIVFNPIWQHIKKFRVRRWFRSLPYRNHRKLILIDNNLAFIGGMNLHSSELKWHDLLVKITGPILSQIRSVRKEMFGILNRPLNKLRKINAKNTLIFNKSDCVTRQIPLSFHKSLKKQLRQICRLAQKELCINTPYFITDPQFHNFLRLATKRGVHVKLLVPEKSDRSIADSLTRLNLFLAYKENVDIRLFSKMTHAKFILADDILCSFGSSNMDYQSFYNNYELNITSNNKSLISSIHKEFNKNWNASKPFNPSVWTKRSRLKKLKVKILNRFRKYF